jgi:hypothetical protein
VQRRMIRARRNLIAAVLPTRGGRCIRNVFVYETAIAINRTCARGPLCGAAVVGNLLALSGSKRIVKILIAKKFTGHLVIESLAPHSR